MQILLAFEMSRIMTKNTSESLQRNIAYLGELRTKAPDEVKPVLDLCIATDHAVLSKLSEQAKNPADAARHQELAQSMFRSLGWKDVSPNVLNEVADGQLQSRLAR